MKSFEGLTILRHRDKVQIKWCHVVIGLSVLSECHSNLTRAIGPVIDEKDHVAISNYLVLIRNNRLHELISNTLVIEVLYSCDDIF